MLNIEAYVLLEFILVGAGQWAQGWGCRDTKPQSTPHPSSEPEENSSWDLVFHSVPMASPRIFPFTHLVAYSGSGTWNQRPQVGEAGLGGGA